MTQYQKEVNATDRSSSGALGRRPPLVYRALAAMAPAPPVGKKSAHRPTVLDYGAGKTARWSDYLRGFGYSVAPHEIGANYRAGVHAPDALSAKYDFVALSNVVNVQPSMRHIVEVLRSCAGCLPPSGVLVMNYPSKPRKAGFTKVQVREIIDCYVPELRPHVCEGNVWLYRKSSVREI